MKIEPSGVVLTGVCEIQTPVCQARVPAPITAVWTQPGRTQVNVCRACLEENVRNGEWEIPGARIQQRADAAVVGPDGRLMLVVEVKSGRPADSAAAVDWAERIHRNLVLHAGVPGAPLFLLVGFPDSLFLWRETWQRNPFTEPDEYYLNAALLNGCRDEDGSPAGQERAVALWLDEAIQDPERMAEYGYPEWLIAVFNQLQNGTVVRQIPVLV